MYHTTSMRQYNGYGLNHYTIFGLTGSVLVKYTLWVSTISIYNLTSLHYYTMTKLTNSYGKYYYYSYWSTTGIVLSV